nr:PREDICTED: EF-hand calcium-binding domain-containing protein 4A-like isoform X2 [Bemisia tabaci]
MEPTAEFYFNLADREKKGFIVKRDMQRLLESESEVSFSPSQLESVFELMDKRSRGFVTLEEFTVIFENFCGLEAKQGLDSKSECRRLLQSIKDTNVIPRALPELEKITDCLLDSQFSAFTNVYQDVWERFLSILHQDLTLRLEQEEILERNMKLKERDSFNYVQSMMDEMESQIQTERKKIAEEEQRKAQKATARLANELEEKERRLQLIGIKEHELKSQIAVIKGKNSSLSNLNEKLLRQKEQLEEEIAEERKRTEELLGKVGEYKQKLDEKRSEDQEINQIYHVNLPPLHSKLLLQAKGLAEQLRMLFALEAFLLSDKR